MSTSRAFALGFLLSMNILACQSNPDSMAQKESSTVNDGYAYGHDQGNAADNFDPTSMITWFQGDRAIRYCIDLSPDFGLSATAVQEILSEAFAQWRAYLIDHKINQYLEQQALLFGNGNVDFRGIAIDSKIVDCDGNEDLRFYFGSSSPQVEAVKSKFYNPWSFAFRRTFNALDRWSPGLIWVATQGTVLPKEDGGLPNWGLEGRLKGLLLHELGHVYGIPHIPRTIMRSDFYAQMSPDSVTGFEKPDWVKWTLGSIDAENELYLRPLSEEGWSYNGTLQPKCKSLTPQVAEDVTFYALTGRHSRGAITARMDGFTLSLRDSLGEIQLKIDLADESETIQRTVTGVLFNSIQVPLPQVNPNPDLAWGNVELLHYSATSLGNIHAQDGSLYPISWVRNGPRSPLQVIGIIHGIQQSIFADDVPYEEDYCI